MWSLMHLFWNVPSYRRRHGFIVQRQSRTLAHDTIDDSHADEQHDEGGSPDEQGPRLERRIEAHELAVAIGHERKDRIVALAGNEHLAHLPPKIRSELDVRIGDRFILANETA